MSALCHKRTLCTTARADPVPQLDVTNQVAERINFGLRRAHP
jgi:hypothetical protein